MTDDELIAALTEVPGIGPWTAQGALIIALGWNDVVLPGDLALVRRSARPTAWIICPRRRRVLAIAEKWRPYRSLATAYLFSAAFDEAPDSAARSQPSSGRPARAPASLRHRCRFASCRTGRRSPRPPSRQLPRD
jgi:3-methyladenine DNA glycosylase/8-oxoguanine DNA glycosylase